MHSPVSRELKQMLLDMNLLPSPAIIEVEDRRTCIHIVHLSFAYSYTADEHVLRDLLQRLTGEPELPLLLVGGKTVGTMQEIRYTYTKGELARLVSKAGAVVDGVKKKKGRKH